MVGLAASKRLISSSIACTQARGMTAEPERIAREAAGSGLARLWRALVPLRSVQRFMMTGAHPDDEASALLARLALGDGAHTLYVCATRGGGGQNAIGP